MGAKVWLALVLSLIGLTACPPPSPPPLPLEIFKTPSWTKIRLRVHVLNPQGQPLANLRLRLLHPVQPPQESLTNAQGFAQFDDLPLQTTYILESQSPDFLPLRRQLDLRALAQLTEDTLYITLPLQEVQAKLKGKVVDPQQNPISQAIVYDGDKSALTDATGQFELGFAQASAFDLKVAKQGFQRLHLPIDLKIKQNLDLGALTLTPTSSIQVQVDLQHHPLGWTKAQIQSNFSELITALSDYTWDWEAGDLSQSPPDILWLLPPTRRLSTTAQKSLLAFVRAGGKLVINGEWSGFQGSYAEYLNPLLQPLGLKLNSDSLQRAKETALEINKFAPQALTNGLTHLKLYHSASVETLQSAQAELLAWTKEDSFQIANQGSYGILATSLYGNGKVILIGDTSLWLNQDSDQNGRINLKEADNLKLAQAIFAW